LLIRRNPLRTKHKAPALRLTSYPLSYQESPAAALLSAATQRDPPNRPWSVAEYTFGDVIRRHEAQYTARAAAALAEGIEPLAYEPFITGLLRPDTSEGIEDQRMQQHSNEYWAAHFRAQIVERPDLQEALKMKTLSSEPLSLCALDPALYVVLSLRL
jgi:hypothetical protein